MQSSIWLRLGALALAASSAFAQYPRPAITRGVGLDQNLNSQVPLDLMFHDETGAAVPLRTYFGDKPVVLSLVYFRCTSLCPMTIRSTIMSLSRLGLKPGSDYNVLFVSFDPSDTPADAAKQKSAYVRNFTQAGYNDGFHFLTGSQDAITSLTKAVGWRYRYDPTTKQYIHAGGIMVATPEGKLSRYFYGLAYAPQDVRLSLVEAAKHQIGSPADYITLFCFCYDPNTGRYTLAITNLLKAGGILTVLLMAIFITISLRSDKKKNSEHNQGVAHVG